MLMLFWLGSAEDYYYQYSTIKEIDWKHDREIYRLLRQVERRIVKSDYATARIFFDPAPYITMSDRKDEFARAIPDVLYRPIGRKSRKS